MFRPGIIDPRPAAYRAEANTLTVRDLKDCGRWGLHLSDIEYMSLLSANPDTLGHSDRKLQDKYWKQFIAHPISKPYRVQENI